MTTPETPWENLYSVDQVASLKGVNRRTVLRAIWRGELKAMSFGQGRRKVWLIYSITAERWQPRSIGRPKKERSGQP
jgi:excisionase family DNA binding protein